MCLVYSLAVTVKRPNTNIVQRKTSNPRLGFGSWLGVGIPGDSFSEREGNQRANSYEAGYKT